MAYADVTIEEVATALRILHKMEMPRSSQHPIATLLRHKLRAAGLLPEKAMIREMPFSEVCMHMKVAGTLMIVSPAKPLEADPQMYQLHTLEGASFSFPITKGEAGMFFVDLKVA